ncbi:MAG: zinc-binding alcohol dehydrogenase [Planctomycetaceae bacterium]|nr:zinc-binding alcohol dehydrogenase [Planctomycetaceae bacterium]
MKQLLVTGPCVTEWVDVPEPECAVDGLVVRARLTAVSTGTEIRVFRGIAVDERGEFLHETVPFELPAPNGYSMVGTVEAVGDSVEGFSVGDRVFLPAAHAEVAAMPADLAVRLPESVSDEAAVFLNILEVSHIALRRGDPTPGCQLAVLGQGVIGLAGVAYGRAFGLETIGIDPASARREIGLAMGATAVLDPTAEDFSERIAAWGDGGGADVVLEAASGWDAIRTGMDIARTDATIVVVARHTDVPRFNPVGHPYLGKRLNLVTSYGYPADGGRWDCSSSRRLTLELLAAGRISLEPLITDRIDCNELPTIYGRLAAGEPSIVGVVVSW